MIKWYYAGTIYLGFYAGRICIKIKNRQINEGAKMAEQRSIIRDPWNAQFVFFWYNDFEVFHATQDDLDRRAKELSERGINLAITFSCTHFRWSFMPFWDQLFEVLKKIVIACHKYGISVVEHHSATLTYNPIDEADVQYLYDILRTRKSKIESWPGLLDFVRTDPVIDGVPMSAMRQVDGRTGEIARSTYHGLVMCPNNADYRRAYMKYLERVYATGVDGIMTDDVQYFAMDDDYRSHACACSTCRKLFQERTGFTMPEPGDAWMKWYGNHDDPSFRAWLDFRFRSVEDYHRVIKDHYESLGLDLLRPNYISHALTNDPTAYVALERLPKINWVSAECCFSDIIRYAWPSWAVELSHRYAVGRWRKIPPGAYMYPDRADTILFTWALAMSWGVMWQPIQEGGGMDAKSNEVNDRVLKFSADHADLLRKAKKFAGLGFYESRRTRELYGPVNERSMQSMNAWMHACYRSNVPFDLFQREEMTEQLKKYKTVMLNEVALLSEEELRAFKQFVEDGGTLIWAGLTGVRDESGELRSAGELGELWGFDDFECAQQGDDIIRYAIGKGTLITVPLEFGLDANAKTFWSIRWVQKEKGIAFDIDTEAYRKRFGEMMDFLASLGHEPEVKVENVPPDVLVTAYLSANNDALAVHLVNASGTWDIPKGTIVRHTDPIPFPAIEGQKGIRIQIAKPSELASRILTTANYYDPMSDNVIQLMLSNEHERVTIQVPSKLLGAYGLIELR